MMTESIIASICMYVMVGGMVGGFTGHYQYYGRKIPFDQAVAAGILAGLFCPLMILAAIGFAFYEGIPFLGRGFAGLYRTVVPAKVKLPKAQVLP